MPRRITITTPENVTIEYELAGIASRGGAALIDLGIQLLLMGLLIGVRVLLATYGKWPGASWANAALGIVSFAIYYGYFLFFETLWNGQTPGKRLAKLRTIREGGLPIDLQSAAVRNLVRIVDFLPVLYILGGIVIIFSSRNKRLGDQAAGTLVVKERGGGIEDISAPDIAALPRTPEADCVKNIELLRPDEFETIKRFIERRAEIDERVREEIAEKIAAPIMDHLEIQQHPNMSHSNLLGEIFAKCVDERGMR